jgi:hypothetical protein
MVERERHPFPTIVARKDRLDSKTVCPYSTLRRRAVACLARIGRAVRTRSSTWRTSNELSFGGICRHRRGEGAERHCSRRRRTRRRSPILRRGRRLERQHATGRSKAGCKAWPSSLLLRGRPTGYALHRLIAPQAYYVIGMQSVRSVRQLRRDRVLRLPNSPPVKSFEPRGERRRQAHHAVLDLRQRNSPSSSRLAKRHTPVPSQNSSFTQSTRRQRKT